MTVRDNVLRVIRESARGMTDAEIATILGQSHQAVNQRCRQLEAEGLVVRDRSSGHIVNLPADPATDSSPAVAPPPASAIDRDWWWEGNVQAAIVGHLASTGWRVTRVADTASQERGIDVTAERGGRRPLVKSRAGPRRRTPAAPGSASRSRPRPRCRPSTGTPTCSSRSRG